MCEVVNLNKEKYDIYIGRSSNPSKGFWGNPYSHKEGTIAKYKVSSRKEAIEKYESYLLNSPKMLEKLPELKFKKLGCWCSPKSCHGDILKKYVSRLEQGLPIVLF